MNGFCIEDIKDQERTQAMAKWIRRLEKRGCEGMISLETLISLTFFMFFMFFIHSYVLLFMAHNLVGHALVEAGQSLALESYGIAKVNDGKMQVADLARHVVQKLSDSPSDGSTGEGDFYTHTRWFDGNEGAVGDAFNHSIGTPELVERRFKAYLGGNSGRADEILNALRITNLSFSESRLDGQDLTMTVSYDIDLMFRVSFGPADLGRYHSKQKTVVRLWGKHETEWWRELDEESANPAGFP